MLRNEIFEAHLFCTVTFGGPSLTWSTATHYRAKQNYTLSTGAQVFQCLTSKFMSLATRTSNRLDWDTVERLIALPIELFARNAGKPCARVFNEFKSAKRSETKHTGVPEFGKFPSCRSQLGALAATSTNQETQVLLWHLLLPAFYFLNAQIPTVQGRSYLTNVLHKILHLPQLFFQLHVCP